jgi:hypothetical protein
VGPACQWPREVEEVDGPRVGLMGQNKDWASGKKKEKRGRLAGGLCKRNRGR